MRQQNLSIEGNTAEELFFLEQFILRLDAVGRHLNHLGAFLLLLLFRSVCLTIAVNQRLNIVDGPCCFLDGLVQTFPTGLYNSVDFNVIERLLNLVVNVEGESG